MKLGAFDTSIIVGYLVLTIIIGFVLTKRAAKGLNSYFMADKKLPFWILGVSDAGGMFDITENSRIGLFVNNAFNKEYMTRPGFIEAPRNVAVQYNMNF